MLEFNELNIDDRHWMQPLVNASGYRCTEYSFTFTYLWREVFKYTIARYNGHVIIRSAREGYPTSYLFPAGTGDIRPVITALYDEAISRNETLVFHTIPTAGKTLLEELYPDKFEYIALTDFWDYIYDAEKMITLVGKKLANKRNHINRFKENYPDWSYEPISAENLPEVIAMNQRWVESENEEDTSRSFLQEVSSVDNAISDFFALGLKGGVIRAGGQVIAFTMGDRLTEDTLVVHIEKAYKDIQGAYAIINQQFAQHVGKDYTYINREDDSGHEGLRRAKRSYRPVLMGEKYGGKLMADNLD